MKTKKKSLLFFLTVTMLIGCKKETIEPNLKNQSPISETINPNLPDFKTEGDVLVFDDFNHATLGINSLGSMTSELRLEWSEKTGIKTKQTIMDEIRIAEEEFDENYFYGLDENISLDELNRLGKPIKFSDKYNHYLNSGLITQFIEKDGSYSYSLNLYDKNFGFIVNEEGFVIIGDVLYLFDGNNLAYSETSGFRNKELLQRAINGGYSSDIKVLNFSDDRNSNSFFIDNIWTNSGTDSPSTWTWYYDSSKERFRHYVKLHSNVTASTLYSTFSTEAIAEKKKFFKWAIRNDYNPIQQIDGNWSYWYVMWYDNHSWTKYNDLSGGSTSPFYYNYGGYPSNHFSASLNPSGFYSISTSSGKSFYEPVHVYNMSIHGYYVGSTGNYNVNFSH